MFRVTGSALVASVALNIALVPHWGARGAAVARAKLRRLFEGLEQRLGLAGLLDQGGELSEVVGHGSLRNQADAGGAGAFGICSGRMPCGLRCSTRISASPISISRMAASWTGCRPGTHSVMKRVASRKITTA